MIPGQRVRLWDGDDLNARSVGTYGHWYNDPKGPWVVADHVGGSDYSGGLIARSNFEAFVEEFEQFEDTEWFRVTGGYHTFGVVVRFDADERIPAMAEFFNSLESYPSIDDARLSRLEVEEEERDWENWGRRAFTDWLRAQFDSRVSGVGFDFSLEDWHDLIESMSNDELDALWRGAHGARFVEHDAEGTRFRFDEAFDDRDLIENIRDVLPSMGERFQAYLASHGSLEKDVRLRIEQMAPATMDVFFDFLWARSCGGVGEDLPDALDLNMVEMECEAAFNGARGWSYEDWSVLLDAMEEEGPDAFKRGHVGYEMEIDRGSC